MKIKPGMFVRTKHRNEIVIRQIKVIFETSEHDHQLVFDKPTRYQYYVEDNNFIAKERLIELVEVGDYVNEYKIIKIFKNRVNNKKVLISLQREEEYEYSDCLNDYMCDESIHIYNENIKSIVTKEQFEKEKYMIGDD